MISLKDYNALLNAVYDGATNEESWQEVGRSFARALRCHSFVLGTSLIDVAPEGDVVQKLDLIGCNWTESALDHYYKYWIDRDPWIERFHKFPRFLPQNNDEIYPVEELVKSPCYNDFAIPFADAHWFAGARAPIAGCHSMGFSFHRGTNDEQFNLQDLALFAMLLPHCARSLRLRHELQEQRRLAANAFELLARLAIAACVLDHEGRLLFANRRAERVFQSSDGLSLGRGGRLGAALAEEQAALQHLLGRDRLKLGPSASGAIAVARPSGKSAYQLHLLPEPSALRLCETDKPRFLLLIGDPADPARPLTENLVAAYGLTGREAAILAQIAEGLSLPEIAERLGIGHGTVRTHTKSLLAKTGCRKQVELANLVNCGVFAIT